MKHGFLILLLTTFSFVSVQGIALINPQCKEVDAIAATVYGQEGFYIITQSDLQRPGLGGQLRSLSELTFEGMVYLDALKHKVIIDDEAIDKYLQMIMRENKVTIGQIEQSFKDVGYTVEEGREQLRIMQTVSTMSNLRINRNLVIPRKDVEQYYYTYPEYVPEEYIFQYSFIAKDNSKDQFDRINECIEHNDQGNILEWTKPFVIEASEIAEEKSYLRTMQIGTLSKAFEAQDGYEVYRLVAKKEMRQKTLDERYHTIVEILRRPRMRELQDEYRATLEKVSSVMIVN